MSRQMVAFNPVRAYLPQSFWGRDARYYAHALDFNMLAASAAAQTESFQVDNGNDFLCTALAMVITTDATGSTEVGFPEFRLQIQSDSGGTFWGKGFQHAGNIFGRMTDTGLGPFEIPGGQLVRGGDAITVSINNLEATARRVFLTFHGINISRSRGAPV